MRLLCAALVVGLAVLPNAPAQTPYPYAINTLAGTYLLGNGGAATAALIDFPLAVTVDNLGNIYVADGNGHGVRKINAAGVINQLVPNNFVDIKADSSGNVYAADGFSTIYKITPSGTVTAIAGGSVGFGGDGSLATSARLNGPSGIALDGLGNLFIADTYNNRVREVNLTTGIIKTVAGNGSLGFNGNNGQATSAQLAYPTSVAVDAAGNIFIAEYYDIRKVLAASGLMTTLAGEGSAVTDGPALNAAIGYPVGLTTDAAGNLYVADTTFSLVRTINPGGTIHTIAGMALGGQPTYGYTGDGGPAVSAELFSPSGVARDTNGFTYIADEGNQRIRRIDQNGAISTIAGAGHFAGDGAPAAAALMDLPEAAITDVNGNIYFSDTFNNRVRRIGTNGTITTVAGNGVCDYTGDHGPASAATLCRPQGLAIDSTGNIYVTDSFNSVVREIGLNGFISTFVGTGDYGDTGNNGQALAAELEYPFGLALDAGGNLYISDQDANRVRKVTQGVINLVAGTGTAGSTGDGGLATSATLNSPGLLATDSAGNVYISDTGNNRVRKVASGLMSTVAGVETCCGTKNGGATGTYIGPPGGLAVNASGTLFVSEPSLQSIAAVTPDGAINLIAGTGIIGFSGDGGLAASAELAEPQGLWLDSKGNILVADTYNSRIRELTLDAPTSLSISSGDAQSSTAGTPLALPLIVKASFQAGVPIPGISISFAATSGTATLSTAVATTDATGSAGIGVTLGGTPGAVVITATLTGLPPVQFHLTAVAAPVVPAIATGGISGAGGSIPPVAALSPGGLATVYGFNLAPAGTSQSVQASDFVNGSLPTQLAGVCVQVGGVPAFLTYVSATQINFQVPHVPVGTSANVVVVTNCGAANPVPTAGVAVPVQAATPEFLYWVKNANGINPVIAINAVTGAYVGATGLIAGVTFVPAKPGDYLTIYGVSFGPTSPAIAPGAAPAAVAGTTNAGSVTLGTTPSFAPLYVGVSPGTAGLYQLNIQVPAGLPNGDYPLILKLGSFSTPTGAYLTIQN
jgi:uncharacterized protein (TIGR03437 family)